MRRRVWDWHRTWSAIALLAAATAAAAVCAGTASAAFPDDPPNDPLYDASPLPNATNEQWNLVSPEGGFDRGISADRAWRLSTGQGVTVADLDVGVQLDHPDLVGRWYIAPGETGAGAGGDRRRNGVDDDRNGYVDDWRGWDFYARDNDPGSDTSNSHGINVAGVLGAATDNGEGIAGIAPDSRLLPLRTADNILHQGSRLAQGIVYATDRQSDVISMSLGADSFPAGLRAAVRYAHRRGVVMTVAAGNEFHFHHHFPQVMGEVLAVGGINPDTANLAARDPNLALAASRFDVRASYSNFGPHLDVVAPTQVPTTDWGGGYRKTWDGTSAATPHVAGVAALVKSRAKALGLELAADEVIQLIRQTADDLTDRDQGFGAGWDRLSGWGRVNAHEAVRRVARSGIPPVTRFTAPDWYAPQRGSFEVRGEVRGRSPARWTLELGVGEQPRSWRTLAAGGATAAGGARLARVSAAALPPGGYTLRLRSRDATGNIGEDRLFFTALRDPDLVSGYPKPLGSSGESSPVLADVDCDGAQDVVLATSDGRLSVRSGRSGRMLSGWPTETGAAPGSAPTAARIGRLPAGLVGTPAVGDIAGDGAPELVAPALDGRVHAFNARGRRLPGFPFAIGLSRPAEQGRLDAAVYASPALADLDGDGKLDVVFGAADQRLYAVDGRGRSLPGWPVLLRDGGDAAKILSSPAIGDLDGDGSPEVVEGTGEAYGSTPLMSGRVYALTRRGRRLAGWPVRPGGVAADSIPLVGEGVPVSPSLADVDGDGDDEVAVAAFTGQPELYDGDGTRLPGAGGQGRFQVVGRGVRSPAQAAAVLALGANAAFGRAARGGPPLLFGGMVDARLGAAQLSPAVRIPFEHLLGGWDARSGRWLDSFPAPVEGWTIVAGPALADVDGDGRTEALAGSSGNVLHAFRLGGGEPRGWPKQAAGWLLAAPAVGDLDGDRRLEVVAVTRDGHLFAWNTRAPAREQEWPSFRHDVRNTGNLGTRATSSPGCPRAARRRSYGRPSAARRPGRLTAAGRVVPATPDAGDLPFTGLTLALLALAGLVVCATGAAVRRRLRR